MHWLAPAAHIDSVGFGMRLTPDLWGCRFKFDDHESALTPGQTRVARVQADTTTDARVVHARTVDAALLVRLTGHRRSTHGHGAVVEQRDP